MKPLVHLDQDDDWSDMNVRAAYVLRFGARCAGWLVGRSNGKGSLEQRRKFRRQGLESLHMSAREEEPPWFQIAIEYLDKYASRWEVVKWVEGGIRRYRIRWNGRRALPLAIVPIGVC